MIKRYVLKPCPFCGGKSKLIDLTFPTPGIQTKQFRVGCTNDQCPAHVFPLYRNSAENAIDNWNQRFGFWKWLWHSVKRNFFPYL